LGLKHISINYCNISGRLNNLEYEIIYFYVNFYICFLAYYTIFYIYINFDIENVLSENNISKFKPYLLFYGDYNLLLYDKLLL
jgi:hypothetical protein